MVDTLQGKHEIKIRNNKYNNIEVIATIKNRTKKQVLYTLILINVMVRSQHAVPDSALIHRNRQAVKKVCVQSYIHRFTSNWNLDRN